MGGVADFETRPSPRYFAKRELKGTVEPQILGNAGVLPIGTVVLTP